MANQSWQKLHTGQPNLKFYFQPWRLWFRWAQEMHHWCSFCWENKLVPLEECLTALEHLLPQWLEESGSVFEHGVKQTHIYLDFSHEHNPIHIHPSIMYAGLGLQWKVRLLAEKNVLGVDLERKCNKKTTIVVVRLSGECMLQVSLSWHTVNLNKIEWIIFKMHIQWNVKEQNNEKYCLAN